MGIFKLILGVLGAAAFANGQVHLNLDPHFNWTDCGPADSWLAFHKIAISPVPVHLPGSAYIEVNGTVKKELGNNVKMVVDVKKWLLGRWHDTPCQNNLGSCTYPNGCDYVKGLFADNTGCPPQFTANHVPCTCPFSPMNLHLPKSLFNATNIESRFGYYALGDYRYTLKLFTKADSKLVGCLQYDVSVRGPKHTGFIFN